MDVIREAETGEAVSCAVSLDGVMVPLRPDGDGEACWREASSGTVSGADGTRLKTLSFGRMPETGKTTALLAAEVAHVRKVRPDAGRCRRRRARQLDVSRDAPARRASSRFLSRLRTSQRSCRPSRPTGTTSIASPCATPPTASTRSAIRYLRDKATTKTATAVLERELRFFRRHRCRMRYASLKAKGCTLRRRRSRQQGAGQPAHEAGRHALERRRRPERPHLQGVADVRPLRRRVAGDDRNARRERQPECRRSLTAEIPPLQTKPECQI